MLNEAVKKLLGEQLWYVATFSDEPNAVPVGFKMVSDEGDLIIGDVFMDTTAKNIEKTGKASVSVCDPATSEAYQVKGSARYFTEGPVVDMLKKIAAEKFNGAMTVKGAVVIKPEKVIVATPGPDNNKVL